jgi:hypothetical protein
VSAVGIDTVDVDWVQSAARNGGRARLVGTVQLEDGRVHLEVKPQLVSASHPFAKIRNEENCLLIDAGATDTQHVWTGRGAGRWPTTAAVMADLFDLSRELRAANAGLTTAEAIADDELLRLAAASVELRDPRRPCVSPCLEVINSARSSILNRKFPQLTPDHWPLTTDFGGAA